VTVIGGATVDRSVRPLGVPGQVLPAEVDLGPRLIGAIRDAMATTGGDLATAGPIVQDRMTEWAGETAGHVARSLLEMQPDVVLTSLFGVEVLTVAPPSCPWAM
jgi:hypothetical protein